MHIATLLLDDDRSFDDGRPCFVARTAEDAQSVFLDKDGNTRTDVRVDELWLDFVLRVGSGADFAQFAARNARAGTPLDIGVVNIHSSSFMGAALMEGILLSAGYKVYRADLGSGTPLIR